jgi:threonine dehydrogenase-like Zn-dependent dehydrogenase
LARRVTSRAANAARSPQGANVLAIEYVRSIPRYLTARWFGPRLPAVYASPFGTVRLRRDAAPPRLPTAAWVRVQPRLAGICGSDLATLTAQGSTYFSPFTSCPFTFGHEVVGEVVELGADADGVGIGDRVVLEPPLHCVVRGVSPVCSACRDGHTAHCHGVLDGSIAPGIQTGFCRDTGGGWSQSFVAHPRQLHRVPEGLADDVAVLVEPFACCLHAARMAPLAAGQTALVLGAGTIGALTIAALRAVATPARIVAIAKYPHQQALARRLGADVVLPPRDMHDGLVTLLGARAFQPELGGRVLVGGADVTFDCVGSSRTLDDALRFTRHHGSVILVGMPAIPRGVDWTSLWHKELTVRGAYTSTTPTFTAAIAAVAALRSSLAGVAAARFPLDRYRDAIGCALNAGSAGVVKTVFAP